MFTLRKFQRLKKPADFQRVYKSKQWGSSQHYTFNVLSLDDINLDQLTDQEKRLLDSIKTRGENLLGVTVSKKVSKRAVDRNRIKRQMREFFRHHQAELNRAQLVITAKPSCLKASDEQRMISLQELWQKIMKWQRWHAHQKTKTNLEN